MIAYAATAEKTSEAANSIAALLQVLIAKIPLWIAAFIIIILSVIVAKIARRIVENKMAEKGIEQEHQEMQILGGRMTYVTVLTIGITIALKIAGIDLTTILAAVAFGVGFALKDLIMNFLAGVMILVGRHFTLGDFIDVGGTLGKVVEIQSRVTVLQALDGTKVIVPNSEIFKKQVKSFTSNPFRRLEVSVEVDYRNNLENAMKVCMEAVKKTKGILLEPKPSILVQDFGDSGMSIKVKAWVESKGGWLKIKSNLIINIKKDLEEHGINIPWPTYNVINDNEEKLEEKIMEEQSEQKPLINIASVTPVNIPVTPDGQKTVATKAQNAPQAAREDTSEKPLKPIGEMEVSDLM